MFAKYRGFVRRKFEDIFGIRTVRNDFYQGGLEDQTYEGIVLETIVFLIPFALFSYILLKNVNFMGAIGLIVMSIYPFLLLLIRIRTFSDSSILKETGLGYHPAYCYLISVFSGGYILVAGFASLNFHFPLTSSFIMIITGFIIQGIPLFPDYINKLVSFEIRSIKWYKFLVFLGIILFFISFIVNYIK